MKKGNVAIFVPHVGCPNTCSFCNQNKISGAWNVPNADEVRKTCGESLAYLGERAAQTEIAFFGGSFTAINRELMISLLNAASEFVGEGGFYGIRVSTRPDCVNTEILTLLKQYKVTAIEIGIQSMDNNVLNANMRGHTSDESKQAAKLIKSMGFSLGAQMMTGLYLDTVDGAVITAKEIIKLSPDTVRIYPTVVIKGTELERLNYTPIPFDETVDLCAYLLMLFTKAGINVIKLGLHASEDLKQEVVAGIYHPAFREICESKIMYKQALELLDTTGDVQTLYVHSKGISKLIGHSSMNMKLFKEQGYKIKITTDDSLGYMELRR